MKPHTIYSLDATATLLPWCSLGRLLTILLSRNSVMSLPFYQKNECLILQAASSGHGFPGTLPVCLPPGDILLCPAVCHKAPAFLGVHRRNRLGPIMSLEEAADSLLARPNFSPAHP